MIWAWALASWALGATQEPRLFASKAALGPIALAVDVDDDDRSGQADASDRRPRSLQIAKLEPARGDAEPPPFARLVVDGEARSGKVSLARSPRSFGIQAIAPGRGALHIGGATREVRAIALHGVDAGGREVDLARSHASFERGLPSRADDPASEGISWVIVGHPGDLPRVLVARSLDEDGRVVGRGAVLPLREGSCPEALRGVSAGGNACAGSRPLRVVIDDVDGEHPLARDRSITGVLGGAVELVADVGGKPLVLGRVRVGGPRAAPWGRYRVRLRATVVRAEAGGPTPVGGDARGARAVVEAELRRATSLWQQCGIGFAHGKDAVRVEDPPGSHLLAVGCDLGLRASGGRVALRVAGRDVRADVARGSTPAEAARVIAAAIEKSGARVIVSPNARTAIAAFPTVDLLVRDRRGRLAAVGPLAGAFPGGALTDDRALGLCIGRVDLSDGLSHFADVDSIAGSLEERTLLKAWDDGDPSTAELIVLPAFSGGGRVGESFISADGGALRNVVLVDRGGVRAGGLTSTLAHEIGHLLLDEPGHPDDYGADTPTLLMDADAARGDVFGPRRLGAGECARALREHGPGATGARLLEPWPFAELPSGG